MNIENMKIISIDDFLLMCADVIFKVSVAIGIE